MFRSSRVPRAWAMFGMAAGMLACLSATAVLFGGLERGTVPSPILILPEIVWEAFLGIYMTFKGFRPSPILTDGAVATAP
jgi:hypothetical protein